MRKIIKMPSLDECDEKCTACLPWASYISILSTALLLSIYIASIVVDAENRSRVFKTNMEKIDFVLKDGTVLVGTVTSPKDAKRKFPTVLHFDLSYQSVERFNSGYKTSTYFAKNGIAFIHVGIRGHIESGGIPDPDIFSKSNTNDAAEVIEKVRKMQFSDGNVGLFGYGLSGGLAVKVAAELTDTIMAVLLINPMFDPCCIDSFSIFGTHNTLKNIIPTLFGSILFQLNKKGLTRSEKIAIISNQTKSPNIMDTCFSNSISSNAKSTNLLDSLNFENIYSPIYIIQGMYDSAIGDTTQFYSKIREHFDSVRDLHANDPNNKIFNSVNIDSLKIKVVIGPFGQNWIDDYDNFTLKFNSRLDVIKFVKVHLTHQPVYSIEPDMTIFIRDELSAFSQDVDGYWCYSQWPIRAVKELKYCLSTKTNDAGSLGTLDPYSTCSFHDSVESLNGVASYKNNLILSNYWKYDYDTNYLQCSKNTNAFILTAASKIKLLGNVHINLHIYVRKSTMLSSVTIFLEYIDEHGYVGLITSKTINGFLLKNSTKAHSLYQVKDLVTDLDFSTWAIRPGQRVRLSFITEPGDFIINSNDKDNFITIPNITGSTESSRKVIFTRIKPPKDESALPPTKLNSSDSYNGNGNLRTFKAEGIFPINNITFNYAQLIDINVGTVSRNFTAEAFLNNSNHTKVSVNGTLKLENTLLSMNLSRSILIDVNGQLPINEVERKVYEATAV